MRLIVLIFCLISIQISAEPLPNNFIHAINMVETTGRTGHVIGDNGDALGPFQIHYEYWADTGIHGKYEYCTNMDYSVRVINTYLNKYAAKYISNNDFESLARIHHGGPNGANKRYTLKYWYKVRYYLDSQSLGLSKTNLVSP